MDLESDIGSPMGSDRQSNHSHGDSLLAPGASAKLLPVKLGDDDGIHGTASFSFDFCTGATDVKVMLSGAPAGISFAFVIGDVSGDGVDPFQYRRPAAAVPPEHVPTDAVLFNTTAEASTLFRSAALRQDANDAPSFDFASFPLGAPRADASWLIVTTADDRGNCHATRSTRSVHLLGVAGTGNNVIGRAIGVFRMISDSKLEPTPISVGTCQLT
jgi:hypothetical protein